MGNCNASEKPSAEEQAKRKKEAAVNKDVDTKMEKDHKADEAVNKLLLLGAGESGKSTLFKQMITIYGKGFPDAERKTFIPVIHNNIIVSMKTLATQVNKYGGVTEVKSVMDAKHLFERELKGDEEIDETIGNAIMTLWTDQGIQNAYEHRSSFQLMDSAKYFFDRIPEIMKKNYIPTEQDVLRSRVRTTGILENEFVIDGNQFKMFDVGGQRNERKKWIHCFENVTAVLFVVAISEYDQVLYEDDKTNRMVEALTLFEEICNSRWFTNTSMILFLNKRDLFAEKIVKVPLSNYFPDYQGPNEYEAAATWIRQHFESLNHTPKRIYTHVTCATDQENIQTVFNAVKETVIRRSLVAAGLA